MRKWKIIHKVQDSKPARQSLAQESADRDAKAQSLEFIIKVLLNNRGLKTKKEIEEFLHPKLDLLDTPLFNKQQLTKAIKRVKEAIAKKEKIIVYSDYDVDGITGAAILWETLYHLHANVLPYVPSRMDEGYGLSTKGIDNMLVQHPDATLIITVDHGITAVPQVEYAKKKGIEVIITDHHTIPATVPDAFAIVHTTKLAGSGVAYMFSHALRNSPTYELDYLQLAAFGTIADLVPLTSYNRVIAKYGLVELNKTTRVGLQALINGAGLHDKPIGTYEVSHLLAPRINASGRLTHAIDSLRLLCTTNSIRAKELAAKLSETNTDRQTIMSEATLHARTKVVQDCKLIFIAHESYHEGVIGLVAGRLVEEFYRPAIVIAKKELFSKASARSVAGFNIIEAIRSASEFLVDCGGHPMAAGFTIATKKIALFEKKLTDYVERELSDELLTREMRVDMEIDFSSITKKLYQAIAEFAPFGVGNPEPTFVTRKVSIIDARCVGGDNQHLKLTLNQQNITIEGIGFGMGSLYSKLSPETTIDLVYTISSNKWNGQEKIQLKIRDITLK